MKAESQVDTNSLIAINGLKNCHKSTCSLYPRIHRRYRRDRIVIYLGTTHAIDILVTVNEQESF